MADSFSSTGSGLVDVVAGVLAEHGPMTEEQLVSVLRDRGVALGDDPHVALVDALDDADGLVTVLVDERWASLPALLAGRVFTHRLTGPEVEHDILDSSPDLDPVDMLTEYAEYQRLADGSPVVGVLPPVDAEMLAERGVPPDVAVWTACADDPTLFAEPLPRWRRRWRPAGWCTTTSGWPRRGSTSGGGGRTRGV